MIRRLEHLSHEERLSWGCSASRIEGSVWTMEKKTTFRLFRYLCKLDSLNPVICSYKRLNWMSVLLTSSPKTCSSVV